MVNERAVIGACEHGWPGDSCGQAHPYIAEPTRIREKTMDADMRKLLEAVRDAMTVAPDLRHDAADAVYGALDTLLGDRPPSVIAQAEWLRHEVAEIRAGRGTPALARRTLAGLITDEP